MQYILWQRSHFLFRSSEMFKYKLPILRVYKQTPVWSKKYFQMHYLQFCIPNWLVYSLQILNLITIKLNKCTYYLKLHKLLCLFMDIPSRYLIKVWRSINITIWYQVNKINKMTGLTLFLLSQYVLIYWLSSGGCINKCMVINPQLEMDLFSELQMCIL
jgi:hypothetical protein